MSGNNYRKNSRVRVFPFLETYIIWKLGYSSTKKLFPFGMQGGIHECDKNCVPDYIRWIIRHIFLKFGEDHFLNWCQPARQAEISNLKHTLKTGIPIEEGDSILKLLRRVSRPEIQEGWPKSLYMLPTSVMEFTFQVRSKLLAFSLRKLSTSTFIS